MKQIQRQSVVLAAVLMAALASASARAETTAVNNGSNLPRSRRAAIHPRLKSRSKPALVTPASSSDREGHLGMVLT